MMNVICILLLQFKLFQALQVCSKSAINFSRIVYLNLYKSDLKSLRSYSQFSTEQESNRLASKFYPEIDNKIANIALPTFISLIADPLASMVDALYIGRLDPVNQAGMGISIAAHYSISKLYNDPLLKTSTSLVAGKTGEELSASVSTAIVIATLIGSLQTILFIFFSGNILTAMRIPYISDMRTPALAYLRWRALGIPASTVLLVAIGDNQ
jgi:Na+-driven multidrug efflux pump